MRHSLLQNGVLATLEKSVRYSSDLDTSLKGRVEVGIHGVPSSQRAIRRQSLVEAMAMSGNIDAFMLDT